MKLCIRQKVFSWNDRFTVYDELGHDRYYVEGEIFSFGKKLHVFDLNGKESAYIQQKLFTFLPKYTVYTDNCVIAEVVKEFTFFTPHYTVRGLNWEVRGDFFAHNYEIIQNNRMIGRVQKEWLTWGDCYTLELFDAGDEISALAVVLTIDCAMAASSD